MNNQELIYELTVGDWVLYKYSSPEEWQPRQWRVVEIETDFISLADPMYCCYPIPLTSETLKANGFEDCVNRFDLKIDVAGREDTLDTFSICKDWTDPEKFYLRIAMMFPRIRYVHELQRALRCCGLYELANNLKLT